MGPAWEVKISFTGTMLKPPHVLQNVSCVRAATLYAIPPSLCTMFLDMYEQSLAKLVGASCFFRTGQRQCNRKGHQSRNDTHRNSRMKVQFRHLLRRAVMARGRHRSCRPCFSSNTCTNYAAPATRRKDASGALQFSNRPEANTITR